MGLKIRGIYATALTCFFLEHDYSIANPSRPIKARFKGYHNVDVPEPVDLRFLSQPNYVIFILKRIMN